MTEKTQKDRSTSVWEDVILPSFSEIEQDIESEICIVGGGISGLSLAYQLGNRGHKVVLLEGAKIGSGQSGRTTAHLAYQPEKPLSKLKNILSLEQLSYLLESHRWAIDKIEHICIQEEIECDFKRNDGYVFLGPGEPSETLIEELKIGRELGMDLSMVEEIEHFSNLGQAIKYPYQAQFHPLKYMRGLLNCLKNLPVEIYEDSHVREFHRSESHSLVVTNDGIKVKAKYLIVTADSPVNNRFHIHTKQAAFRTYVLAIKMGKKIDVPLMCDTSDPYFYIRQEGEFMLVGGKDHRTGQPTDEDPFQSLEKWAREHFPWLKETTYRWSGQIFESMDQVAYIGKNPGIEKNVFIVTGLGGQGMTYATIASLLIPDIIEEKENRWLDLYAPSRFSIKGAKEFIRENSNIAFQYKDWITPAEIKNLEEIPRDHGGVVREGVSKTCVFHTAEDNYERVSAVCTHLGGIVHWNDVEKTWDCPCHGSRYNVHGKVIEGPALIDLLEK